VTPLPLTLEAWKKADRLERQPTMVVAHLTPITSAGLPVDEHNRLRT